MLIIHDIMLNLIHELLYGTEYLGCQVSVPYNTSILDFPRKNNIQLTLINFTLIKVKSSNLTL